VARVQIGPVLIRRERADDESKISAVHADAFASAYPNGQPVEPKLVENLRSSAAWLDALSLVDGSVAGHVCCSRAVLFPSAAPVLALGPLGVRERTQRAGVGAGLMHAVLAAADALDEPLVVLLGHPDYYLRFGFRLAAELGIDPEVAAWAPVFQARTLSSYRLELRGQFRYARPFYEL
jgi:putative acetyltransferase